jgi:hypothetical protein
MARAYRRGEAERRGGGSPAAQWVPPRGGADPRGFVWCVVTESGPCTLVGPGGSKSVMCVAAAARWGPATLARKWFARPGPFGRTRQVGALCAPVAKDLI